jgi:hypothetical protein
MKANQPCPIRVFRLMRGTLFQEAITAFVFAGLFLQTAGAVAPIWWTTRSVFAQGTVTDDYAVANVGQLKSMAKRAAQEMRSQYAGTGGAGTTIDAMLTAWEITPLAGATRDDYAALTVGQLKQVASKYYERLAVLSGDPSASYPWAGGVGVADDYALANVGQLKAVFAFSIGSGSVTDSDHDGLFDTWELQFFGNLDQTAAGDYDGDGVSNGDEVAAGTGVQVADSDGDGIPDGQEIAEDTDPLNAASSSTALIGLRVFDPAFTNR